MFQFRIAIVLAVALTLSVAFPPYFAHAGGLIEISGRTELTSGGPVSLTIDEFEALAPPTIIKTSTPWHAVTTFSGVSGVDFIRVTGATGQTIVARAANEYQTRIPLSDLTDLGVLFVTRMNGKRISLREKGPVFIIYPFDQNPEVKSEIYYGRSIWQLVEMRIE